MPLDTVSRRRIAARVAAASSLDFVGKSRRASLAKKIAVQSAAAAKITSEARHEKLVSSTGAKRGGASAWNAYAVVSTAQKMPPSASNRMADSATGMMSSRN